MPKIVDYLDKLRSHPQLVYDPTFVYNPWRKWIIGAIVLVLALGILWAVSSTKPADTAHQMFATTEVKTDTQLQSPVTESNRTLYEVIKVVDGDTIDVKIDGRVERLRLIGIDTPETVDSRKIVQCFGREASDQAKSLLAGAKVSLESDASQDSRDKYDRLLRYVYLEDGTSFNEHMIAEGYAHEYTYDLPYKHQQAFKDAEKKARETNKGLWSSSTCGGDTEGTASTPKTSPAPSTPAPATAAPSASSCDPNYTPCVPKASYDLDCGDIGFSVRVIGTDTHRFDRDGNGYGCESY